MADAPPESGPAALHSHVSRLRAHLGPAAGALETVSYRASTTLRGFAAYAAGELANAAGDPERAITDYTRARQLARECGATFLDGSPPSACRPCSPAPAGPRRPCAATGT